MINEDGVPTKRYVVAGWTGGMVVSGDSITLQHDQRAYIAQDNSDSFSPEMFKWYYLAGKTVSFNVDLSSISCSCNAALYFVSMPGHNPDGSAAAGSGGDYYCDANDGGGVWCWEMDVMEANKYVTQITPHKCNSDPGTYISWCDGGGCATNGHNVNGNGMGPGGQYTIDTTKEFHYAVSFNKANNGIHARMTQEGRNFEFDVCQDASYLQAMAVSETNGMVLTLSFWGDDYGEMQWLDGNTGCGGSCDTSGSVTFSNITIA
jgi:hypothetical protein